MGHEFLSIYPAKLMEYGLAVTYLLMFVPVWKYIQGGPQAEAEKAAFKVPELFPAVAVAAPWPSMGWFQLPAGALLHPGHTWARMEADGTIAVGLDDFAQKLVAPQAVTLPRAGSQVAQGESAIEIGDALRTVPMVSPVDGTVVAVNAAVRERPELLSDPYGAGWLFKVKPQHFESDRRQLLYGSSARHFLDGEAEALALRAAPEVGQVLQDGGLPVNGLARALAGEESWDELAREFFHTVR